MSATVRLYRLHRGAEPKPGNAGEAAHLGDYPSQAAALRAAKGHAPVWIEPIDWNGDVNDPVFKNAGKIAQVSE